MPPHDNGVAGRAGRDDMHRHAGQLLDALEIRLGFLRQRGVGRRAGGREHGRDEGGKIDWNRTWKLAKMAFKTVLNSN